jgi:hypothetical protein
VTVPLRDGEGDRLSDALVVTVVQLEGEIEPVIHADALSDADSVDDEHTEIVIDGEREGLGEMEPHEDRTRRARRV